MVSLHFRELEPAGQVAAASGPAALGSVTWIAASGRDTISGRLAAMAWTVETLNETVDAEVSELPADMRARLTRTSD